MQFVLFSIWFMFSQVSDPGPSWPSCFPVWLLYHVSSQIAYVLIMCWKTLNFLCCPYTQHTISVGTKMQSEAVSNYSIYGQCHAKRDLQTYAKSVDPDQPLRLRRRVWSGSALFDTRHINVIYFSCCVSILSCIGIFNIVYGLIWVYTIRNVRRSLFA